MAPKNKEKLRVENGTAGDAVQSQTMPNVQQLQSKQLALLKHSFTRIMKMKIFSVLKNSLVDRNQAESTMGLNGIKEKFDSYQNVGEFLIDINRLVRCYSVRFAGNHDMKETADELSELCHRDVLSLQSCTDCFEHWINDADNHFTKVCTLPHVLVYAKFSDFPHWPAKIMSVDGNMVNVEFFGDHKQADVLASNCFLYSTRYPGKIGKNDALQDAIEELGVYISNIKQKFGEYHPAPFRARFDPKKLAINLYQMVPGAKLETPSTPTVYKMPAGAAGDVPKDNEEVEASTSPGAPTLTFDMPSLDDSEVDDAPMESVEPSLPLKRKAENGNKQISRTAPLDKLPAKRTASDSLSKVDTVEIDDTQHDAEVYELHYNLKRVQTDNTKLKMEVRALEHQLKKERTLAKTQMTKYVNKIKQLGAQMDLVKHASRCVHCNDPTQLQYFCNDKYRMFYQ